MFPLLAALAVAAAPYRPPMPNFIEVNVSVVGSFSDEGRLDENLINAPVTVQRTAKKLALPPGTVEALQRELPRALERACATLKLRCIQSDLYVSRTLLLRIGGENGLGGHFGGTDVRAELRYADQVGRALATVKDPSPVNAQAALETAIETAIRKAFEDLDRSAEAAAKLKAVHLTLVFALDGLSDAQRQYVVQKAAPCAAALLGVASGTTELAGQEASIGVDMQVEHADDDLGPLPWAIALETELGTHAKHRCSLFGSPLAGYRVSAAADAPDLIRVRFAAPR